MLKTVKLISTPGGYSWDFLVGDVPPGSQKLFRAKKSHFPHPFTDLASNSDLT